MKLYTYWRSTAAYRVRMALNLKGLAYDAESVHLVKGGGEQHSATYRALNPQGLVPALVTDDGDVITQSMAIMEYLEAEHPEVALLPTGAVAQAQCRAMAQMIVSDVHPLNNLKVLQYLKSPHSDKEGWQQEQVDEWYAHWIHQGFTALEQMLVDSKYDFMNADYPCISDICLVAQVYNAQRFNVPLDAYPKLSAINARCLTLNAIDQARPENQFDAT